MPELILAATLEFFYAVYMIYCWRKGRRTNSSTDADQGRPLAGFDDETEIVHARLAHFATQIGHWRISSMVKNNKR